MKTKEELSAIKEEYENMNKKLAELSEDELKQVVGGVSLDGQGDGMGYSVKFFPGLAGFP